MGAENIKMGTCSISYKGTDLGLTSGGVEVEVTTSKKEIKVDQFGDTVANEFIMGRNITVKAPLAETTLQNIAALMPGATLVADAANTGTIGSPNVGDKYKVTITSGTGVSLFDSAGELILHPIDKDVSDVSEDLTIPLAATAGELSFAYKYDEERIFNAEFKGYPDNNATPKGLLFIYGDKTATA